MPFIDTLHLLSFHWGEKSLDSRTQIFSPCLIMQLWKVPHSLFSWCAPKSLEVIRITLDPIQPSLANQILRLFYATFKKLYYWRLWVFKQSRVERLWIFCAIGKQTYNQLWFVAVLKIPMPQLTFDVQPHTVDFLLV